MLPSGLFLLNRSSEGLNFRFSGGERALSIIPASATNARVRLTLAFAPLVTGLRGFGAFRTGIGGDSVHLEEAQTPVTAVTAPIRLFGDTSIVNMVRRACKKAFFEPGDTRQAVERGSRG
jgi:hypothetical protein